MEEPQKTEQHQKSENRSWRTISTDKYIIAGIITALIFFLGLALGLILEDARYGLVQQVNQDQEVRYLSLQLQYLFLTTFQNEDSCPVLTATLQETITDLSSSLNDVISFEESKKGSDKRKTTVERRYLLDNLRYWLLARESKQKCSMDIVPILYFYTEECADCAAQGTILTYYKNLFDDKLLVFPINLDLVQKEPMAKVIRSQYNVTAFPTLVIDTAKHEGVVDKEEIKEIICSSLREAPQCQS
ncbi:hypothetical protein HY496_00330 [Candidatus Woesearchaeota archaeon]|nr:hypothetical protein [Candidatus Woesearchaeota archaeon]